MFGLQHEIEITRNLRTARRYIKVVDRLHQQVVIFSLMCKHDMVSNQLRWPSSNYFAFACFLWAECVRQPCIKLQSPTILRHTNIASEISSTLTILQISHPLLFLICYLQLVRGLEHFVPVPLCDTLLVLLFWLGLGCSLFVPSFPPSGCFVQYNLPVYILFSTLNRR